MDNIAVCIDGGIPDGCLLHRKAKAAMIITPRNVVFSLTNISGMSSDAQNSILILHEGSLIS